MYARYYVCVFIHALYWLPTKHSEFIGEETEIQKSSFPSTTKFHTYLNPYVWNSVAIMVQ